MIKFITAYLDSKKNRYEVCKCKIKFAFTNILFAKRAEGFGVRGIKIVERGKEGLFVSMPSRKTQDGYRDICFPVTAEFRNELHTAVLDAYHQALTMAQTAPAPQAQPEAPKAGQQNQYVEMVLKEHFEGGKAMANGTRTLAFQVSEELFMRIKDHLKKTGMSQKDFVIGLIENALQEAEKEKP